MNRGAGLKQLFVGAVLSVRAIAWLPADLNDHRDLVGVGIHVLTGLMGIGYLSYGIMARLRAQHSEVADR